MSDDLDEPDTRDATPEEETMVGTIMAQRDRIEELEAKLAKAVGVLKFAQSKISWEINPSNYDHDDVCDMNSDWCEIGAIVDATLTELKGEQP